MSRGDENNLMQEIVELSRFPVFLLDGNLRVVFENSKAKALDISAAAVVETLNSAECRLLLQQTREVGDTMRAVLSFVDDAGASREVVCGVSYLEKAAPGGLYAIWLDVEDMEGKFRRMRERVEVLNADLLRARRKERRLRMMFDAVEDGMAVLDELGNIETANPQFAAMVSKTEPQLLGRPLDRVLDLGANASRLMIEGNRTEALQSLSGRPFGVRIDTPDGQGVSAEIRISAVSFRRLDSFVIVLREDERTTAGDMADRQDALTQARDELREKEARRTRALGVISHEMRTPLAAIIAAADLIEGGGISPADQAKLVAGLRLNANEALQEVSNLLELVRMENVGSDVIPTVDFNPLRLLRELVNAQMPLAKAQGIDLRFQADLGGQYLVRGHQHLLQRAAQNLIGNALKYAPGATVTVLVRCSVQEDRLDMTLSVSDTGPGIEQDKIADLFTAFETGSLAVDKLHSSTGLGLNIVKRSVNIMGGTVDVRSRVGAGTTFRVKVGFALLGPDPDVSDTIADTIVGAPAGAPQKKLHVLVADDNDINRSLLHHWLDLQGVSASEARDGLAALAAAEAQAFDLIFMDLEMPRLNGLEATRRILAGGRSHTARIVGLTAHRVEDVLAPCQEAGMYEVLSKPISLRQIQHQLRVVGDRPEATPRAHASSAWQDAADQSDSSTQPLLDIEAFETYCRNAGEEYPRQVSASILEIETALARINAALHDGAMSVVADLAHDSAIKARALGALELSKRLLQIEVDALQDRRHSLQSRLDGMPMTLLSTRRMIEMSEARAQARARNS
ncbi:ATP-binding protein [Rhodovulum sp. FJ3]|uniref:ATP-binding protein n=1 Tax=Rhodovulum sp. FJ3 TaxID=3079053 RepID=UPI00293DE9BA|nr:ATP-binding protein [Rhodovulum sp. FJ3]MDV4167551.1 response regulator [Rhodovulum sp. FJ3]